MKKSHVRCRRVGDGEFAHSHLQVVSGTASGFQANCRLGAPSKNGVPFFVAIVFHVRSTVLDLLRKFLRPSNAFSCEVR